jgi:hypothetical protein
MSRSLQSRWLPHGFARLLAGLCLSLLPGPSRSESDALREELEALSLTAAALEATQFSTTTKLSGQISLVLGGNQFGGSAQQLRSDSQFQYGATTFNYDARLILDTSFTGQDLLRIRLRSGNFDNTSNSFGGAGPSVLSQLEVAFQAPQGSNLLAVNRLYYQWPIGEFTFTLGARIEQDNLQAIWPSVYPSESVLDLMTFGGAIGANNLDLGTGAGLWWQRNGFAISASYVAANGQDSSDSGGIGTSSSGSTASLQVGYAAEQWALAAMVSAVQNGEGVIPYGTNFTLTSFAAPGRTSAFGLGGYWQPSQKGWLPSISAGWGINRTHYNNREEAEGLASTSQSWSIGVEWDDAFRPGNNLGMAVGQPTFATALVGGGTPDDSNLVWECWYRWRASDQVSVTPALFFLSRPLGADTPAGRSFHQLGALVKTSFSF